MGFLLLGADSLIACIAVGPIVSRRLFVPFAALFGICDAGGFLLGSALHWSVPASISAITQTAILVALGIRVLLSSALLGGLGLAIGLAIASAIPAVRSHTAVANGVAGGALILASGALLLWG